MRAVLKTYYYHYQHCHHLYCKKTENWSPDKEDDKRRNDEYNKEYDDAKRLLLVCSHELAFHNRTGARQHFLANSNFSRPVEPAFTFDEILTLFAIWGWLTLLVSFPCSWRLPVLKIEKVLIVVKQKSLPENISVPGRDLDLALFELIYCPWKYLSANTLSLEIYFG